MFYITFGESPSGVYKGQVIDVCRFLNERFKVGITLIAFISLRNFFDNRKRIKKQLPGAIVVPMTPKIRTWKLNAITLFILCLFTGERVAVCRNVMAANLAWMIKKIGFLKTLCYDGRGAAAAEYREYLNKGKNGKLAVYGETLEVNALVYSDFRIAVSQQLVEYWKNQYGYSSSKHVVIPCTVSEHFSSTCFDKTDNDTFRAQLGYKKDDVIFVYAGSTAGWQSFSLLNKLLYKILRNDNRYKVLFLSREDENNNKLKEKFPQQVDIKWVLHKKVPQYLQACDYGLLYREQSITNKVAAPTKFAEYLICGLPVIISENLGDYTDFVKKNACGIVLKTDVPITTQLENSREFDSREIMRLGKNNFTKHSATISSSYEQLVSQMS